MRTSSWPQLDVFPVFIQFVSVYGMHAALHTSNHLSKVQLKPLVLSDRSADDIRKR